MSEKVKKKLSFLSLTRSNSRDITSPDSPKTPEPDRRRESITFKYHNPPVVAKTINVSAQNRMSLSKRMSTGGIEDLIQCSLCLEKLNNPKMLPCQHTFCYACLSVYIADLQEINCPLCDVKIRILSASFLENLPSNLYIDSLLQLVGQSHEHLKKTPKSGSPPLSPVKNASSVHLFPGGCRCTRCETMCDSTDVTFCDHCKQNFCIVCWSQHLDDLQSQMSSILKQLESASNKLDHKIEHFRDRCERIAEQISDKAEERISMVISDKERLLREAKDLRNNGDLTASALKTSLNVAISTVATTAQLSKTEHIAQDGKEKVKTYINLHQNALQLIDDVSKWDVKRFVFDNENFSIDMDAGAPLEAESDDPCPGSLRNDPLESEDNLVLHYRSRSFIPHYVWRKTPRPCGVAESPWDNNLYICGMDTHTVLVIEKTHAKIVARLCSEEMLCPTHIAFIKDLEEIYVTDKWKHCVHVFNKEGVYLRTLGQKGSRVGMFRSPEGIAVDNDKHLLYVVDTGNDRVQILQVDGKYVEQIGVVTKNQSNNLSPSVWQGKDIKCTELNAPTSVAIYKDRVIVLDSGNRRVKIYNKNDRSKIFEFGSLGQRKGQFRQPEVLTVDPLGFIIVGDSGNSRVQIFKPSGQLVRVFGGLGQEPGKFGWISGIYVTKQLDIIISDPKNHNVSFI